MALEPDSCLTPVPMLVSPAPALPLPGEGASFISETEGTEIASHPEGFLRNGDFPLTPGPGPAPAPEQVSGEEGQVGASKVARFQRGPRWLCAGVWSLGLCFEVCSLFGPSEASGHRGRFGATLGESGKLTLTAAPRASRGLAPRWDRQAAAPPPDTAQGPAPASGAVFGLLYS